MWKNQAAYFDIVKVKKKIKIDPFVGYVIMTFNSEIKTSTLIYFDFNYVLFIIFLLSVIKLTYFYSTTDLKDIPKGF